MPFGSEAIIAMPISSSMINAWNLTLKRLNFDVLSTLSFRAGTSFTISRNLFRDFLTKDRETSTLERMQRVSKSFKAM